MSSPPLSRLTSQLQGEAIPRGHAGYDRARQVFNAAVQRYPALIVRCAGVNDVVAGIRWAREHELELAVRGGGHSVAGFGVCDDGLVLDLSCMKEVKVSTEAQTVTCGPGVTWADLDARTARFGLATPGGVVSSTGVGGLALGGGVGWLIRKYGLTCDNLLSAELITADGRLAIADEAHHCDIFWGLRGGGGNFGVVTSFTFRLHPVPSVFGGRLHYTIADAVPVLRHYGDFVVNAAEELTLSAAFNFAGRNPVLSLVACCCATTELAREIIRPVIEFGRCLGGNLATVSYPAMQQLLDDAFPAGRRHYWKTTYLDRLSTAVIGTIAESFLMAPSQLSMILIESYTGAAARVEPSETAYPHRRRLFNVHIVATWLDSTKDDANIAWAADLSRVLHPFAPPGAYANFLNTEDARARTAFGENCERLTALKQKWDPTNVFRHNVNVPP